jgi:2-aminobenzoate-CoA ligase
MSRRGGAGRICIQAPNVALDLRRPAGKANRIANVLVKDLGIVPGNRVLLRAPNNPMMAACWFAVMKVGAVATATMPLLRAKELKHVIAKAKVTHALCDLRLAEELKLAAAESPELKHIRWFNDASADGLEAAMAKQSPEFRTSIPRATTPASSPSPPAPRDSPRRPCISTAT